jgi:hypothetical protein
MAAMESSQMQLTVTDFKTVVKQGLLAVESKQTSLLPMLNQHCVSCSLHCAHV